MVSEVEAEVVHRVVVPPRPRALTLPASANNNIRDINEVRSQSLDGSIWLRRWVKNRYPTAAVGVDAGGDRGIPGSSSSSSEEDDSSLSSMDLYYESSVSTTMETTTTNAIDQEVDDDDDDDDDDVNSDYEDRNNNNEDEGQEEEDEEALLYFLPEQEEAQFEEAQFEEAEQFAAAAAASTTITETPFISTRRRRRRDTNTNNNAAGTVMTTILSSAAQRNKSGRDNDDEDDDDELATRPLRRRMKIQKKMNPVRPRYRCCRSFVLYGGIAVYSLFNLSTLAVGSWRRHYLVIPPLEFYRHVGTEGQILKSASSSASDDEEEEESQRPAVSLRQLPHLPLLQGQSSQMQFARKNVTPRQFYVRRGGGSGPNRSPSYEQYYRLWNLALHTLAIYAIAALAYRRLQQPKSPPSPQPQHHHHPADHNIMPRGRDEDDDDDNSLLL